MMNLSTLVASRGRLRVAMLALAGACTQGTTREFLGPNAGNRPPDMVRLSVKPGAAQLVVGDSVRFLAYGHFGNGDSAVVPATWGSRTGMISEAGWYQATVEGLDTVQATSKTHQLFSATAALEVDNPLLDQAVVQLTPSAVTLSYGHSIQFVANVRLPDGTEIAPELIWNSTGGTIGSSGLFTALGHPGTYQVTAQITGRTPSGATSVTVLPGSLEVLSLNPSTVVVAAGETRQFSVSALWTNGSTALPALVWSATGGTVSPSGLYAAGQVPGTYRVIVAFTGGDRADTSAVTVASPANALTSLSLTPTALALAPGATGQFMVAGSWSDGSTEIPAVTYSATGGTITVGGGYTAGDLPGVYKVIATHEGGSKADTSTVTIAVPAGIVLQLVLSPSPLTLAPGGNRQFAVAGLWSNGSTTVPAATYSATGGTITVGGLYTAGVTPGIFRVIATQQGGTKADTAMVTISAPPATLTHLVLTPASVTLAPGAKTQFAASGTWSNGSSTLPTVTYSATGGTITTAGSYTAGTAPGAFHVIATQQGGTKSDTAAVTIMVDAGSQPLWTADMETGNLKQWEDNVYQQTPCGGQSNSGPDAGTVASRDYARSGVWSAKMVIGGNSTTANTNGTRMQRWCEPQRNRELFYSVWYYIPQRLTVNSAGWMNVFQFKSKPASGGSTDPVFFLDLRNAPATGAMRFMLTWWKGLQIEGPSPGLSGYRTWNSAKDIPVGRWFHVQARYVCAGDFKGAVQVWQDGVEIFKLEGVRTRYQTGDCQWSANNYGTGITPSPATIYIDDAVISRSKISP